MRVLARQMAREMTVEEIERVSGAVEGPKNIEIMNQIVAQSTGTCMSTEVAGSSVGTCDHDNSSD